MGIFFNAEGSTDDITKACAAVRQAFDSLGLPYPTTFYTDKYVVGAV